MAANEVEMPQTPVDMSNCVVQLCVSRLALSSSLRLISHDMCIVTDLGADSLYFCFYLLEPTFELTHGPLIW